MERKSADERGGRVDREPVMPLFYFHLRTPAGLEPDEIGLELAGIEAAYLEACRTIPGLCADLIQEAGSPSRRSFEITDAAGTLLMEVPFSEVLDGGGKPARPPKFSSLAEQTQILIGAVREQHEAVAATLSETYRLLEQVRKACSLMC
ncbi:DUF6894 family protein [Methylorubrum populi]